MDETRSLNKAVKIKLIYLLEVRRLFRLILAVPISYVFMKGEISCVFSIKHSLRHHYIY